MSSDQGPVERATRAELRKLGWSVRDVGNAALAVSLAQQIDASRGAVGTAAAAAQLKPILDDLAAKAEALRPERNALDELRERRYGREGHPAASA